MREKSKKTVRTRLLALLLVFCMTFQMVAYSPGNVVRAEGEETGVSEALDDEGLSLPENTPENDPGDAIVEPETEVIEKETVQPTDWTVQTEGLKLTLAGISCQKGDEEPADLETVENRWDLSALNPEDAEQLILTWQYAFAEDVALNSGDSFSISMPKTAEGKAFIELKDTEAPAALTDSQDNEIGSYTIKENTATVTLNEAAAESAEAVSGTLELSGTLNAEALKTGEATDATLAPQGEAGEQWTLVLPGKEAAEAAPAPAPTTEPEQKKENPVMNGLKALFGVQQRAMAPTGPQDVTNNTSDITLEIPYVTYQAPDGVVTDVPMKADDNKTTIDLSQKPYEPDSQYQMELDFTLIDKDGENNLPNINENDYFLFKIPKALIAPSSPPADITSPTGKTIATCSVEKATEDYADGTKKEDYPYFVKVTFTSVVDDTNYYGISGGFTLNLGLNPDGVGNPEGDIITLTPQGDGGHSYDIILPPIKHKVEGVSKSAVYNEYREGDAYKKEITWNITVGDKTPGADLAGVKVTDTLPAELRSAGLIKSVNNNNVDLTTKTDQYKTTAEGFTYTFPKNTTAPQTITVVTTVPESVYNALADKNAVPDAEGKVKKDLKNEVALTTDSAYVALEGEKKADATATIERPTLTKTGEQKSSDLIAWTITVNDTGAGNARYNIYDAVVTDTMSADLSMNEEMLGRISVKNMDTDTNISVKKWTGSTVEPVAGTDNENYWTYKETGANGEKQLKFYFYGKNNQYDRTMSNAVRIEFETKVDSSKYDPADNPDGQGRANKNTATLTCGWPYGTGIGPGIEYGLGPIGTDYRDVYVDKTGKADTTTGLITWTIDPSTRIASDNKSATITDTIIDKDYTVVPYVGKHSFVKGSIKVYKKENLNQEIHDSIAIEEPTDQTPQTFKVTITGESLKQLNDLVIIYQTKADNFFDTPNGVDYKYKNRASLSLVASNNAVLNASDDADVVFPNRFLSKGTEFIKDGTQADGSTIGTSGDAYMKYTIRVNENRIPFTSLEIKDIFSVLLTHIKDKNNNEIISSPFTGLGNIWEIDKEKTEIKTTSVGADGNETTATATGGSIADVTFDTVNNDFTFKPANPSGKQYTITLYLKLTEQAKTDYLAKGDCKIYTENKATANGTYDGKTIKQDVTSSGDGAVGTLVNKLADKEHGNESDDVLKLNWKIDINPYAAKLGKENTTLTIEDTIASGMEFDRASIKLLEKDTDGDYQEAQPALDKSAIKVTENANGGYTMSLEIPKDSTTYRLEYATNVIGRVSGNMADNHAVLKLGETKLSESGSSSSIDRTAWGTLQTRTTYKFVKHDSLTGTSKPLAGATFGLYSASSCDNASLINYYTSNAQGIVKFPALDFTEGSTAKYYYKEVGAPEGYKLPQNTETEITKEIAVNAGQVANKRLNNGTATITKKFDTPTPGTASNQQSDFKLYLYPRDNFGGTRIPVILTSSADGSYTYDEAGTEAKHADGTVMKNNASGGLSITNLPWGDYALEEVKPSPGYAAVEGEQRFTVKYDAKATTGGQWSTEYQFGTDPSSSDGKITNALTKFEVQKTAESSKDLNGAKFEIQGVKADKSGPDGSPVQDPFNSGSTFKWEISTSTTAGSTHEVTGLPAGTYYLVETQGPTDATIARSKSVKFTLDNYGKITEGGDKNIVTMSDPTVKIKIAKKDQFKAWVKKATLKVEEGTYKNNTFTPADPAVEQTITTKSTAQEVIGLKRSKTYQLEETKTPDGYLKANPMVFSIDDYGEITIPNNGDQTDEEGDYKNQFDSNQTLTLTDERIVGHVQFKKMDSYVPEGASDEKPLAGVQFDLYKVKGDAPANDDTKVNAEGTHFVSKNDGTVTTLNCGINDQSGETLSHGLRPGTYYFKEVATHNDFVLPTGNAANTPTFEVKSDGSNRYSWQKMTINSENKGNHYIIDIMDSNTSQPYTMLNDPFRCDIFFTKTDAEPNTDGLPKGVVGATYGLYSNADCTTPVTDKNGNKRTVTTKAAGTKNEYTDSNGNKWTHDINNDGEAYFCDVPRSNALYIKEISPAPGYTLNETVIGPIKTSDLAAKQTINLNTNSPSIGGVTDNKITDEQTKIEIAKIKAGTTDKLTGAVLKLTGNFVKQDDTTNGITWTTNNGFEKLTGKLIADEIYTLTEQTPPAGYEKAAEVKLKVNAKGALSASTDGGTNWNAVNNNQYQLSDTPVEVSFDKKDQFNQPVNGAGLVIYKLNAGNTPEGSAIETWTTDRKSHEISAKLSVGQQYRLKEETTPAGYTTAASIDFTITDDGKINGQTGGNLSNNSETLTMTDKRIMAHVQLTKTDTSSNPIGGMQFTMYKQKDTDPDISDGDNGDTQIASFTLGTSGIWKSQEQTAADNGDTGQKLNEGLSVGKYYFLETNATDSYYLPTNVEDRVTAFDVTAAEDTTTIKKTVENAPMTAAVTLKKVDAENPAASIQGAQFTLTRVKDGNGNEVTETAKTLSSGSDGIIKAESLIKGHYILKETIAPEGYDLGTAPFECEFDVTDAAQGKTLTIAKNAVNDDAFNLSITKNQNAVIAEGVANTRKSATFTLEKIDSQNSSTKLNGAKFELYKKTGNNFETDKTAGAVLTAETGKTYDCSKTNPTGTKETDGQLVLNNLPWGDYWIIETVPPAGYQLAADNSARSFTVGATALDIQWVSDAAIKNGQNSLTLKKTDINGSALSGATLEITDSTNKKIGEATLNSSADSWMLTGALTAKETYNLNETKVPDGYETPAKKDDTKDYLAQFQMDNNGNVRITENNMDGDFITADADNKSLTIKNQPIEVTLNKTDMDGNALTDAEFEITGTFVDGTTPIKITDDNKSTDLTAKLIAGNTYTVTETTPPKGYKKAAPFDFTVNANGTVTLSDSSGSYVSATQNDQTNTASQITVKDDLVKTRIKKTDEAGQPIDGAQFTITGKFKDDPETEKTQVVSPTATDAAEILNLIESSSKENPDHVYTLEETRAADGYQRVTEKAEFFICPQARVHFKPKSGISGVTSTDSDEITMTFKDKPIKLGLNKTDENGAALAGVTFNLTGKFADNPSTEATKELTSTDGAYNLDKMLLARESYTLKETAAPPKYQIYENGVKIQVSDDGKNITIEGNHDGISLENNILIFKDKLKLGNIIFDKKAIDSEDDTEASPRDRVTFGLYTDSECIVPVTKTEGGQSVAVTAVSGQDGRVQFTDIPAGVYYIKEMGTDAVNAYYKANNRVYRADIDGRQPANTGGAYGITLADNTAIDNTVINTAVRGDIILKKIDDTFKTTDANGNETDLALSGAQFAVCLKGTKTVVAGITEKAETPGEYALQPVTQITLGDGYTIKLQNDFNIPYLYDNKLLAGEYDIYETAAPGGYIAPDNIVAELHIAEMTTTIGGEAVTQAIITNQIRRSAVTVEKQIETTAQGSIEVKTAKAGAGYQFRLERVMEADGKTPARFGYTATAATKDNGKAEFENVPVGQYQITETAVSGLTEPYVLPGSQTITVREDGSVDNGGKQNQFTNTLKRGSITGVKTDTDTRADKTYPVKGAVIGLFKDGQNIAEATTGENGTYRFDNIPYGSYTLKEIAAPAGYVLNDTQTIDVKVTENGQEVKASAAIANTLMKGSLTLLKTNTDSQKLSDAEFTLTGKNNYGDDITPIVKITGADGLAVFENLPLGSYTLTETRQPDGYERLGESLDVSVTAGSNNIAQVSVSQNGEAMKPDSDSQYTLVNKAAEIVFNKTGHIGELCANGENAGDYLNATKPLEGAKFGLYTQDNQLVKEAVSNDGGQVVFDHVTPGTYLVKELEAPHCYKVDANAYLAVVDETGRFNGLKAADGSSLKDNTILNDAVRGKIKLVKVDEQNPDKRLPGSTYGLYKRVEKQSRNPFARFFRAAPQYDEILIATGVTDENGEILFDGLLTGVEYTVKELAAPAGSQVSEKPIVVKFKLEEGETEPIVEKSDNGSGTADVDKDGNIIWYEPPIMVEVSKKDTNEKMLSGAKLRITEDENKDGIFEPVKDENGDALEWLSSSEPERIANLLKADIDYRLEEIESPAGYTLAEPIDFNVTVKNVGPDENFVDKITMTDTLTALSISKTAINGTDELPGAVLTVYEAAEDGSIARDEAGNEIVAQTITGESLSWTSGTEMKKIEGLKKGTYILREITAPDGYEVAEEITFTLMPDGTVAVGGKACEGNIVRMQDKPVAENGTPGVPDKPQTAPNNPDVNSGAATGIAGSVSPTTFWGVLALLSVAALLVCSIVVWRRKRW